MTFTPVDTSDYTTAVASVPLTVNKATPSISWTPAPLLYGTPTSAAQLDATAATAGDFIYSPLAGTLLQPGPNILTLTFTPADTADYLSATVTASVVVGFSQPCIASTRTGRLTVSAGQAICVSSSGKITGPVDIETGGALWIDGGTVTGPLSINGGSFGMIGGVLNGRLGAANGQSLYICGGKVTGPVTVIGTTESVVLGGTGCAGNTFTGPVTISSNSGGVSMVGNRITGPLTITDNSGGFEYSDNTVTGPVTAGSNT